VSTPGSKSPVPAPFGAVDATTLQSGVPVAGTSSVIRGPIACHSLPGHGAVGRFSSPV
jgi:hypothetical protein